VQVNYAAGEPVWSEREGGDLFYIIKEGSALLKDASSGAVLSKLGPGAHFGQQSLLGPGMLLKPGVCSALAQAHALPLHACVHLLDLRLTHARTPIHLPVELCSNHMLCCGSNNTDSVLSSSSVCVSAANPCAAGSSMSHSSCGGSSNAGHVLCLPQITVLQRVLSSLSVRVCCVPSCRRVQHEPQQLRRQQHRPRAGCGG
jgi:hypothetical protein